MISKNSFFHSPFRKIAIIRIYCFKKSIFNENKTKYISENIYVLYLHHFYFTFATFQFLNSSLSLQVHSPFLVPIVHWLAEDRVRWMTCRKRGPISFCFIYINTSSFPEPFVQKTYVSPCNYLRTLVNKSLKVNILIICKCKYTAIFHSTDLPNVISLWYLQFWSKISIRYHSLQLF